MKKSTDADIKFVEKKIQEIHDHYTSRISTTKEKTDLEKIAEALDEAIFLSQKLEKKNFLALSLWRKGAVLRNLSQFDQAEKCYFEAEKISLEAGLFSELSGVYNSLGNIFLDRGNFPEAKKFYLKSADVAKQHELTERYASSMANAAHVMVKTGENLDALRVCLEALEICEKSGIELPINLIVHTAMAYTNLGEFNNALSIYARYQATTAKISDPFFQATILNNISAIHNLLEDNATAIQIALEALNLCTTLQAEQIKISILMNLGIAYSKEKNFEKAHIYLNEAHTQSQKLKIPLLSARLADAFAQAFHAEENFSEAEKYYSEQIKISREQNDLPLLMKGLCGLARIAENPEDLLNEALKLAQEKQQKKVLAEVYLIFAGNAAKKKNFSDAYQYHLLYHETTKEMLSEDAQRKKEILRVEYEMERLKNELELQRKEKISAEQELERRRQEFNQIAFQLSHSGRAIETIRIHARKGMQGSAGKQRAYFRHIMQAANSQLSPVQWDMFEERFRQLHSDFIDTLRQKFPQLSPTEVKVCALIKSGCSTKEASSLLCISAATLESHRIAIRKKFQLTQGQNLQNFIARIGSSANAIN